MHNKKQVIIVILVIVSITIPIFAIMGIEIYINTKDNTNGNNEDNTEEDYFRGIEISFDLGDLTEPIEILNPKNFNVLYNDSENIIINYRNLENVIVTDYILDGLSPQPIPDTNIIPKPELGNHSLMLLGINGTAEPCNSKLVYFYISDKPPGILGARLAMYDKTTEGTTSTVLFAGTEKGLKASLPYFNQIFLEGPHRTIMDGSHTTIPYAKNIDLKFERVYGYFPLMICKSELWYNHTVQVIGPFNLSSITGTFSWTCYVNNGDVKVIYLSIEIFHLFGSILFWNNEIRNYDVISVEKIYFDNTFSIAYESNEPILEIPYTQNITYERGSDGKPIEYHDKSASYGNGIGSWYKDSEWMVNQGFEGEIFLGNYNYDEVCPVPIRFSIPRQCKSVEELFPNTILHTFIRTHEDPEDYNYNYRGYENIFSYNLYSI